MNFFRLNPYYLAFTFVIGILGPFIHFAIRPKNKWLKTLFRVLAGLALGAYLGLIVLLGLKYWWLQIIMLLFIVAGFSLYSLMRGKRANLRYCDTCPLHYAEPPCLPERNTSIKIKKINDFVAQKLKEKRAKNEQRKQ